MKKVHATGLSLIAAAAVCAVSAASALAADEWLANGAPIAAALVVEIPMELTLISLTSAGGTILEEIACSVIFDGKVGPVAAGVIEDMTNLTNEFIGELGMLNERFLDCEVIKDNESLSACVIHSLVEVWLDALNLELGLTWTTQIELMGAEPLFLNHIFGGGVEKEPGYVLKCKLNGGNTIEELCESLRSAALENVVGGVKMTFNWENPIDTEIANCSLLGANTGALKGSGVIKLTNGETLSVS